MRLDSIVELFVGRRRDENAALADEDAHREVRQLLASEEVDAAAIALMTAQAHGLIC